MITLPGHGFFWFALQPDPESNTEPAPPSEARQAAEAMTDADDALTVVVPG